MRSWQQLLSLLVGILPLLAVPVQAVFPRNQSSYLNVQIPVSLHVHQDNATGMFGMYHKMAKFGSHYDLFNFDGNLVQPVHLVEGNLCEMPDHNVTRTFGEPPFLLFANWGGCTAISKVRRAQELGAAGLIVTSGHCLCDEENCTDEKDNCVTTLPEMLDDGTGGSIHIPSAIISKGNAERIRKALHKHVSILMEFHWQFPQFKDQIQVEFWHSPTHARSTDFLANYSVIADAFQDKLSTQVHYNILDGKQLQCTNADTDDENSNCYNMCTNKGRYCAISHKGMQGKDVVIETLRRLCIVKELGDSHNPMEYWNYLASFNDLCESEDFFANHDCVKDVFKHAKIDEEAINKCMEDTGKVDDDIENSLLGKELVAATRVVETPRLLINGLPFKMPLFISEVMEAMCYSFEGDSMPHVCYACMKCGDPVACASRSPMKCEAHDGEPVEPEKKAAAKKKGHHVFRFFFFVALIGGAGGYVYYKKFMEDGEDGLGSYSIPHTLMTDTA